MITTAADGPFLQRKMSAAQAWHEWMPIRDTPSNFYAINRTLQFGTHPPALLHATNDLQKYILTLNSIAHLA